MEIGTRRKRGYLLQCIGKDPKCAPRPTCWRDCRSAAVKAPRRRRCIPSYFSGLQSSVSLLCCRVAEQGAVLRGYTCLLGESDIMWNSMVWAAMAAGVVFCASEAPAELVTDARTVGLAGSAGGQAGGGGVDRNADPIAGGAVPVRAGEMRQAPGQHCAAFLDVLAAEDAYGLYGKFLDDSYGCRIARIGRAGVYAYSAPPGQAYRWSDCLGLWDARRFARWMSADHMTGGQEPYATANDSYFLNAATAESELSAMRSPPGATGAIPPAGVLCDAAYHAYGASTAIDRELRPGADDMSGDALVDPDSDHRSTFLDHDGPSLSTYPLSTLSEFKPAITPRNSRGQDLNAWEGSEMPAAGARPGRGNGRYR